MTWLLSYYTINNTAYEVILKLYMDKYTYPRYHIYLVATSRIRIKLRDAVVETVSRRCNSISQGRFKCPAHHLSRGGTQIIGAVHWSRAAHTQKLLRPCWCRLHGHPKTSVCSVVQMEKRREIRNTLRIPQLRLALHLMLCRLLSFRRTPSSSPDRYPSWTTSGGLMDTRKLGCHHSIKTAMRVNIFHMHLSGNHWTGVTEWWKQTYLHLT